MKGELAIMDYKILAVDFDGTISLGNWPEVGPANDRLISYLLDRKRYGDKLFCGPAARERHWMRRSISVLSMAFILMP